MTQYNHHAALVHTLWQRKKREKKQKNKSLKYSKQQHTILFARVPGIFCTEPDDKKNKIGEKKTEKLLPLYLMYISRQGRFGQHDQTVDGPGCKRPPQRGTDVSFTCVLRHLLSAKTSAGFEPDPHGTTKEQISYFGDPQTGEISY